MGAQADQVLAALVEHLNTMYARIAEQSDIGKASQLHSEVTAHLEKEIGRLETLGISPKRIRATLAAVMPPALRAAEQAESTAPQQGEGGNDGDSVLTLLVPVESAAVAAYMANCRSPLQDTERFVAMLNAREGLLLSVSYEIINLIASGYLRENEIAAGVPMKTGFGRPVLPAGYVFQHANGVRYTLLQPVEYQTVEKVTSVHARLARLTPERFRKLFDLKRLLRAEMFPERDRSFVELEEQFVLDKTMKDYAAMKKLYHMGAAKYQNCIILRLRESAE